MNTTTPNTRAVLTDEEAVDLLRRMLEIDSVSGQEGPLAEYLADRMAALGLRSWIDSAGNCIGFAGGTADQPSRAEGPLAVDLVLLGHMDTVPGRVPVRVEEGRLYGRGAVDAKGPLAALLVAAATSRLPPDFTVAVIGAVEEETASSRGARHAATLFRPHACIVGEPSGSDSVTLGYKGRLLAELHLRVAGTHSAGPDPTAAELAVAWWECVRDHVAALNPPDAGAFDQVQVRLRSISNRHDGLEDRASASIGFRIPPGVSAVDLRQCCIAAAQSLATAGAEVVFWGEELPVRASRDTALVRAFTTAIRAEGATPGFVLKTGTCDMNVVAPVWRCEIVAYGPGDSRLDHTPVEHVLIDDYLRSIRVLRHVLETLSARRLA
jgi:LysW-gamma-L-lysine carboxypeptidase